MKRRDVLSMALGAGVAATGAQAQEGSSAAIPAAAPAVSGGFGGVRMGTPVNSHTQPSSVDFNYRPRRLNKAIELWEDGQPIYYNGAGLGPGVDAYAQGVKMSQTYLDAINVEMEHECLDFMGLREVMRG